MQDKLYLYNTLTRKKDEFVPISSEKVTLYTCGPTAYYDAHIGNMKIYIEWDLLTRVLKYLGYNVIRVMNITDVGQMTSDADLGEDKMMKALKREQEKGKNLTVWDIADMYTKLFFQDTDALNIERPTIVAKATDHIQEMIELIKKLEEKGYAYRTEHAVYFDVSKFPDYEKLSGQKLNENLVGVRDEVVVDPDKRNPADFRLWQLDQQNVMEWDSPWGKGFPGWHIECSAMAMKYLGETIDIHTGGIDHIPVHHTNEIAQSEAATGKPFAHYWMHGEFLKVDGKKMSKSAGTFYILKDVIEKGYDPLDFRYFALQASYRYPQNFTWEAMDAAREARKKLIEQVEKLQKESAGQKPVQSDLSEYQTKFRTALNDDINIPDALAVLWDVVGTSKLSTATKLALLFDFDQVFGLKLQQTGAVTTIAQEKYKDLLTERETAKRNKDFAKADAIRDQLTKEGYRIIDTPNGPVLVTA